jgi:hypothetical protein
VWRELEDVATSTTYRATLRVDELSFDLPSPGDGFLDQDLPFDDEGTLIPTRTAAPDQAPQSLNVRVLVAVLISRLEFPWIGQASAALAAATNLPKASMSRTARSARILRSTSISAAFSPAMNRL